MFGLAGLGGQKGAVFVSRSTALHPIPVLPLPDEECLCFKYYVLLLTLKTILILILYLMVY